jgi:DNA-binding MarR family transcriptional regulator
MSDGSAPAFDRTANVLGALSLAVSDRMAAAIDEAARQGGRPGSETAGVALSALHHFLERPTIDRLRQVLGLTSSGAVRLVDRLEGAGLVRRQAGRDGRTTTVSLTPAGRRAAARVARARAQVLEEALGVLPAQERAALEPLISRVVVGLMREPGATRWMCRLCDTGVCGQRTRDCPVSRAAHERYGGG